MATATLQYRVNGGALHTDSIEVAGGDVISFTAASFAGWGAPAARWEIVAYPPGWTVPAGWSTDGSSGFYYYLANSGGSGVVPPSITLPMEATRWGKWLFRLTVNGTIVSSTIGVETLAPALGLHDLATGESTQFGDARNWPGQHQENLRIIDTAALVSGAFVSSISSAGSPLTITPTTGAAVATWNPTADVSLASHKLTNVTDPSSAQDAATKAYVDSVAAGLDPKGSVLAATTADITLSGAQTIDGVSVTAGKRVLVKDQATGSQNGFYLCAAGAWTRTTDLPAAASAAGVFCFVEQGTANGDKGFVCTSNVGSDVVGTDALVFTRFSAITTLDAATRVWEDTTTALNANGLPTRNLAASLSVSGQAGVVPIKLYSVGVQASDIEVARWGRTVSDGGGFGATGTAAHGSFTLPNAAGTEIETGAIRSELTNTVVTHSSKIVIKTLNADVLTDALTIAANGNLTAVGSVTGTGFVGASLNTASAVSLPIGGTNTDFAFDSTTGVVTWKRATATARTDTFHAAGANTSVYAAGVTSIADTWTQAASGAGGARSWSGQQGASGSIGGPLSLIPGAGGSAAELSGPLIFGMGALVSQTSPLVRIETTPGNLIGSLGCVGGLLFTIKNGAVTTGGLYFQSTATITIEATSTAVLQSLSGEVWSQSGTGIQRFYKSSSLGAVFTFDPTAAMSLAMQARSGTGANAGVTTTISGQPGQNVAAGTNNNGGVLALRSAIPGTGGTGGTDGNLVLGTGATDRITVTSTGAQAHQLDNFENIVTTAGTLEKKVESLGRFTTSNNTPVNKWSYTLPSTFVGSVVMIVDMIDITAADDRAYYERRYALKQRGGGGVTLTAVGIDTEVESDATWGARMVESGGVLSLEITGDASNQTDGGTRIVLDITTYSIA